MAKRKPTAQKQHISKSTWTTEEITALLSWLEHTLRHDELDFDTSIFAYLGGKFKPEQIEEKLEKLWTKNGPRDRWPAGWKKDFLRYGVSCLYGDQNGIGDAEKEHIKDALQQLEDAFLAKQLQSPGRRSRTASKSAQAVIPRAERCNLGTHEKRPFIISFVAGNLLPLEPVYSSKQCVERRQRDFTDSTDALHRKTNEWHRESADTECDEIGLPILLATPDCSSVAPGAESRVTSRRLRSSTLVNDSEADLSDAIREDELTRKRSAQNERRTVIKPKRRKQSRASASSEPKTDTLTNGEKKICTCGRPEDDCQSFGWIECVDCKVCDHACCIPSNSIYICEKCALAFIQRREQHEHPINYQFEPIHATDCRWASAVRETERLQEQLHATEDLLDVERERVENLAGELSRCRAAQNFRDDKRSILMEHAIEGYVKQITDLKIALHNREELSIFTRLTSSSRSWFGKTKIHEGFREIYLNARDILCQHEVDKLPFSPQLKDHPELNAVISDQFGLEDGMLSPGDVMAEAMRLHPQALIRGLTTSALRRWVFEAEYPVFDEFHPLFEVQKEIVLALAGATCLRNFDLATLNKYVSSTSFRDREIPKAASKLAVKLSQVLAPFFSSTSQVPEEAGWDGFSTWRDAQEKWDDRRIRFIDMFKSALLTKADSCLNIEDYEMVVFPPGTAFDKTTMTVETSDGRRVENGSPEGVVEFCVEAAVFSYPRNEVVDDGRVESAVINRRNFRRRKSRERAGLKPLVMAVVVLALA